MKNLNFPAVCRRTIFAFLILNVGFLTVSFTPIVSVPTDEVYSITKSKITILGKTRGKDWQVETTAFNCNGMFAAPQGELESISGFCFKLPVNQILTSIGQTDSTLCRGIQKSQPTEISFVQSRFMILPMMKMAHIIYDVKTSSYSCMVPMQLQYILGGDGQIRFNGKQIISLSALGLRQDQFESDIKKDEITIEIEFTIAKKQMDRLK